MQIKNMNVGIKIRKLRELKNLTQEYVADQLGLTQSGYSKIETGEVDLPYTRLERIAEVLGMKPEDIITFNEQMVFNVMHNQTGNGLIINNNQISEREKNLYEQQIELLKQEIAHLKSIVEKLLNTH